MLALIFLTVAVLFGDILGRRFFSYRSIPHRLSAAFLIGILLSSCVAYLLALLFANFPHTLVWANLSFVIVVAISVYLISKFPVVQADQSRRPTGKWQHDAICLAFCMLIGCWLMFATLNFKDGNFIFAIKSWSDFGANLSLAQSLAIGENYPTVHPFYPSEIVRYHFLFWFLSANLAFLGLNIVWAVNILSILSLLALLILIMTLAELLFESRAVARISALLFFFASSSLSYIPFFLKQNSFADALWSILDQKDFLKSGFPYRGDDWGALSVTVFANQRQLLSALGILLLVIIYIVQLYKENGLLGLRSEQQRDDISDCDQRPEEAPFSTEKLGTFDRSHTAIFCGFLIGCLPYWNSAVFVAASLVMGGLFVLFSKRKFLLILIATIVVVGLPQILLLTTGNTANGYSLFTWGYIIAEPTLGKLVEYLGWTFGFKWLLILLAFFFVPSGHRKLLIAFFAPFVVVFALQLSTEVFNNHKLLNIWNVLVTFFVAYAFWVIGRKNLAGTMLAIILFLLMTAGAIIDLAPVRNDSVIVVPHRGDPLTSWLYAQTSPDDIFLTDTLLSHPILFTGRKIFLGNTLFAWTAGYDLADREKLHRRMFNTHDINELKTSLTANNIAYIAIDDGLRTKSEMKNLNEGLIRTNFPVVFTDTDRRYGNLVIYRVVP